MANGAAKLKAWPSCLESGRAFQAMTADDPAEKPVFA
jgi:hypothetical protein